MEHYDQEDFDFDEKAIQEEVYMEEDPAALLLSDQLMEDEDESEIYEMAEDDEDEIIVGTPEPEDMEGSFYNEEEGEDGLVEENPFEPVYPATAALLGSDENVNVSGSEGSKGIVLEAVSLDNILPAGSRRRRI